MKNLMGTMPRRTTLQSRSSDLWRRIRNWIWCWFRSITSLLTIIRLAVFPTFRANYVAGSVQDSAIRSAERKAASHRVWTAHPRPVRTMKQTFNTTGSRQNMATNLNFIAGTAFYFPAWIRMV